MIETTRWIDSEKERPEHGQRIIFEDLIGLFWGVFITLHNGVVYVEGDSKKGEADWEDVLHWIPFPNEAK